MSVEQTTQLIQLILNSVLMSAACALVLGGLTARHTAIGQQLQGGSRREWGTELSQIPSQRSIAGVMPLPGGRLSRKQLHRLRYRYQLTRYSVLSGYYALLFAGFSCLTLIVRGMVDWNALIPLSLGFFVMSVATLLVAVSLTLVDWHFSDRALMDEVQKLLSFGQVDYAAPTHSQMREPITHRHRNRRDRSNIRVG